MVWSAVNKESELSCFGVVCSKYHAVNLPLFMLRVVCGKWLMWISLPLRVVCGKCKMLFVWYAVKKTLKNLTTNHTRTIYGKSFGFYHLKNISRKDAKTQRNGQLTIGSDEERVTRKILRLWTTDSRLQTPDPVLHAVKTCVTCGKEMCTMQLISRT